VKNCVDASVFIVGLVFGTASSILSKVLFDMMVDDKKFEKPLFQTLMMFVGMSLALPIHFMFNKSKKETQVSVDGESTAEYEMLHEGDADQGKLSWSTIKLLLIPSFFDLVATALANCGLVMIDVSIYQLMKCSVIVFVAIFKRTILRVHLKRYMWLGVVLNMIAVTLVAATSFFPSDDGADAKAEVQKTGSPLLGIFLVVLSCLVQSGQYVFEEKVMGDADLSIPPLVVVGMEGVWGLLLSVIFVLPIAAMLPGNDCVDGKCSYENTWDTLHMLSKSMGILGMTITYVFVITGYNAAAIFVTFLLDSVWHAILDNFRPISVWGTQLALYFITNKKFGEKWVTASWLQLGGLVLLLVGTAVYNATIEVPCCDYVITEEDIDDTDEFNMSVSPFVMATSTESRVRRRRSSLIQSREV